MRGCEERKGWQYKDLTLSRRKRDLGAKETFEAVCQKKLLSTASQQNPEGGMF